MLELSFFIFANPLLSLTIVLDDQSLVFKIYFLLVFLTNSLGSLSLFSPADLRRAVGDVLHNNNPIDDFPTANR